jgi:type IV pilus assembly protein PilC
MEGRLITGDYSAPTLDALEDMLRDRGYFVVDCRERRAKLKFAPFTKVSSREIAVFCRQFSVLLNAGVTIVESMSILKGQTESRRLDAVIESVHDQLQRGSVLSEAMSMHPDVFEEFFINMVKVGEVSGTIDSVMARLADYYERDNKISQKVKSAMTYPVILAVLTVAVIVLLMVKILPMFSDILGQMGEEMPAITRVLMAISGFFVQNFFLLALFVVAVVLFFQYFRGSAVGRYWFDGLKLTFPGVRAVSLKIITARFARSMSILLKSGIPIINAVDIMKHMIGNRVVERRFEACSTAIKEGKGIAGPIRDLRLFPNLLVHMIAVGENSGELDEMLGRTAGFFDLEVEEAIDRLTVMIEPLMIIVLGAVVGVIIVSIMLPMISIMTAM